MIASNADRSSWARNSRNNCSSVAGLSLDGAETSRSVGRGAGLFLVGMRLADGIG
jgi:hypothetical protein